MSNEKLRSAVLALSPEERAALAQELLASLHEAPESGANAAWIDELDRRAQAVADGTARLVEWEDARQRIAARLRERRERRRSR